MRAHPDARHVTATFPAQVGPVQVSFVRPAVRVTAAGGPASWTANAETGAGVPLWLVIGVGVFGLATGWGLGRRR